jgi:hypothetical protein
VRTEVIDARTVRFEHKELAAIVGRGVEVARVLDICQVEPGHAGVQAVCPAASQGSAEPPATDNRASQSRRFMLRFLTERIKTRSVTRGSVSLSTAEGHWLHTASQCKWYRWRD